MKTALVISSFVGAGHVGACVSAFCLRRLGIRTFILPTTLFGRHPGFGRPGGAPVEPEMLADMWQALRAQNENIDAVLTGYMASPGQVREAEKIITDILAENSHAKIIVDPVMGDHGKLYVSAEVAKLIVKNLVVKADIITPNVWELGHMTQQPVGTLSDIFRAAQIAAPSTLVSSVPIGDNIGAMYHNGTDAIIAKHEKFEKVPHGGGDGLAGIFLAQLLNDSAAETAFAKSVSSIFAILSQAAAQGLADLPLITHQNELTSARILKTERYIHD